MSSQVEENEEKINVRDRLTDNLLDLSLMNVSKIPVSEIKALRRATILDLSNNRITQIESNFTELTQLTQLDLSKNRINTICDDFGLLVNLRRLDLYNNQITRLPLTFGRLKNLKYLDLQNNPLNPSFKKLIGTCSDTNDCLTAAKRAVDLMKNIEKLVVEGRIKEREQQHTAEQLVEEQLKKEMVTGEGNSTDDSKQDKLKRKRKQDISEILKEPVQKFASANDVDSNRKTNSEGISSLLWILLVIMTAVGACILYSTHSDTLQTICTDIFGEPYGTILDEYIK